MPDPPTTIEEQRLGALESHRDTVGRGNELIEILRRTIAQIEKSQRRVQWMSQTLFLAGLVLLGVGAYETIAGNQDGWSALLGATGGISALVATFVTAPMERISASVRQLVRLETAFLGYIRILGEVDSAFQMQYLDVVNGSSQSTLDAVIRDTIDHVSKAMQLTVSLIDREPPLDGNAPAPPPAG